MLLINKSIVESRKELHILINEEELRDLPVFIIFNYDVKFIFFASNHHIFYSIKLYIFLIRKKRRGNRWENMDYMEMMCLMKKIFCLNYKI
jgi:hypothetical protein